MGARGPAQVLVLVILACLGCGSSRADSPVVVASSATGAPSGATPTVLGSGAPSASASSGGSSLALAQQLLDARPSRRCMAVTGGQSLEVVLVGDWVTTVRRLDPPPELWSEGPFQIGALIGAPGYALHGRLSLRAPHHENTASDLENVEFRGTADSLTVAFSAKHGRLSDAAPLDCVPLDAVARAREIDRSWRRPFSTDLEALAANRFPGDMASLGRIGVYFRGSDCPDCARVELGALFYPRGGWNFCGVRRFVVDTDLGAPSPIVLELLVRFAVRSLPTFVVFDPRDGKEELRLEGAFDVRALDALPTDLPLSGMQCDEHPDLSPN